MVSKSIKLILIILIISLLLSGCASIRSHNASKDFDELITKSNSFLIKEARTRADKFHYGKALGSVVFPVYFPLVLPDDFEFTKSQLEEAKPNRKDMNNIEGETGGLIVDYARDDDTITVYQGIAKYDDSEITEKREYIDIGRDKPFAFYQKRASGFEYIGWREENVGQRDEGSPEYLDNVAKSGGGKYAFYDNNIDYLIKAKGVDFDQLVGMAKKMTIYDDSWSETNQNEGLGHWQTEKVPWDNIKNTDWQNYLPSK